jgi:hypothetical protein
LMEPELLDVLREAVRIRRRKEELERAIGRALRHREMDFEAYVRLVSELREGAVVSKVSVEGFVKRLLAENEERN